jgi:putative Holliday junction resolvase
MKKICALDYGKARIGVALSDASLKIAFPKQLISAKKTLEETADSVWKELQTLGPLKEVIIGLPLFMNGKESPMSQEVRQFAELLKQKSGLNIIFKDERLTSALGEHYLDQTETKRDKRKALLDGISASILLQNYLDSQ